MSQSKRIVKSGLTILILAIISKLLGFVREMLIGAKFGSGAQTDTFFLAISTVLMFSTILTVAIGTTTIPVLTEVELKEGKEGKKRFVNNLLNIVILAAIALIIIAWILAPILIKILAPGFKDESQIQLAILLVRIGLPSILFSGILGVLRGYLQSENRFTETGASNLPFNFTYIFYLLFLSARFGIVGMMVAATLAIASQISLQVVAVRKLDYNYSFEIDLKDKYVNKILHLLPPVLLSIGITDLNHVIDKALASGLVEGSISALNYANRMDGLVRSLFVTAITTVIYPMLSKEANNEELDGLKRVTVTGMNTIILVTIPATIGMIILATPIVKIAFERGEFDSVATMMTAGAMIYTVIGMVGASLGALLNNVYYSMQDTKTPVYIGFVAVGVNIVLNFILVKPMAHKGLALATSISALTLAVLLLYGLKNKKGSFGFKRSLICAIKSFLAASVMGICVYFIKSHLNIGPGRIKEIITLAVSITAGVGVYVVLIYLLRVEEALWVIEGVKTRLRRKK